MLFNSLTFLLLLLPTLALYWVLPWHAGRLAVLFCASILFYGYHHWPSVFLLLFTIAFNYFVARCQVRKPSRALLIGAVAVNLSLLGWFKYAAFIADNVNALLQGFGVSWAVPIPPVFLPLGISFFTFQVVAYQVDVYRKEVAAETSLARFAVFKCYFPQLIAGPIVRAKDFLPQLKEKRVFRPEQFHQGLWLFLAGMALKIGVADVLAQFANEAFKNPDSLSTLSAWTSLYAYAFQLYADFWGYSTMAVGLAACFGLVLPLNFDTPYASQSLQEFWRRWHITLSIWFRDYVYIPLGGNRRHRDFNLLLTMTLAGLWHGAGWNFILWGFLHGSWLAVERRFQVTTTQTPWKSILRILLVFHGVCLLWVLFRAPNLSVASHYFLRLFAWSSSSAKVPGILLGWLILFAMLQKPLAWTFIEVRFARAPLGWQWVLSILAWSLILGYAGAQVDFIYFTF